MDWALTGALIGLIIAFCYLLNWLVSKEEEDKQKVTIIKWWSRLDDFKYNQAVRQANIFCNEIFDKIYGKRHFSQRCFGVSFCVSIISVFILSIVMSSIFEMDYDKLVTDKTSPGHISPFVFMLIFAVMLNSWIDYISLVETRLILRFALRVKPLMLPVLLLVDLFLTVIVFWLSVAVLDSVVVKDPKGMLNPMNFLLEFATWNIEEGSVLFYSTFSTSIIFYIYCLSTLLFKFVKLSKTRIMIVLEKLEDSDHLFKALGGFLAAVVVFVKAVVEICQYIVQE